jgi:hypothetical protein
MKVYAEEVPDRNANAAPVWFKAYYSHYESLLQGVPICEWSLYKEVPPQGVMVRNTWSTYSRAGRFGKR